MKREAEILGGLALLWFGILRGAKAIVVGIKAWSLRTVDLNRGIVDIVLSFEIYNPLFVGLTLNSIKGDVYVQGKRVGYIDSQIDYYISGVRTHIVPINVTLELKELGSAAVLNIQSGNVETLTIAFNGNVYIGKAGVPIPVQVDYDWNSLVR